VELLRKNAPETDTPEANGNGLARELTTDELAEIGNSFGGNDHSTVIPRCKTMADLRN